MRIADVIAALDGRPTHVVDATAGARSLLRYVTGELRVETLALGAPEDEWDIPDDAAVLVLVAVGKEDDLDALTKPVFGRAAEHGGPVTVLLLLHDAPEELRTAQVMELCDRHELVVDKVHAMEYATLQSAVILRIVENKDQSRLRAQLLLERYTAGALEQLARAAESAYDEVATIKEELARRDQRIDALTEEVKDLRGRLEARRSTHEREVAQRDRRLAELRQRVVDLESSTSYRLGHAIVRVAKDPSLLRKMPEKVRQRVRR